uniref:Uncharacterized protein n=1 Tax=Myotis myotis TaxID=51298 RepID=A0A7J7UPN9_MYOMY|nr:hypothetical protein mMyoMyo1_008655 [Myotis myotis]
MKFRLWFLHTLVSLVLVPGKALQIVTGESRFPPPYSSARWPHLDPTGNVLSIVCLWLAQLLSLNTLGLQVCSTVNLCPLPPPQEAWLEEVRANLMTCLHLHAQLFQQVMTGMSINCYICAELMLSHVCYSYLKC